MVTNECTTSTQHNPSSEANSSTASHKFSTFYACSPIQFFFENHLVIILPYMPRSSNSLLSSYIPTKPLCVFLSSPQLFHVPHPPYLHLIPPVKVIKWRWATQYSVLFSFLKLPLGPRYLQHPILKHPQPMFFPKYDQPFSLFHRAFFNWIMYKTPTHALFHSTLYYSSMFISLKYTKVFNSTPTCFDLKRSSSGCMTVPC